ncbi:Asp23/Gls24 family envelope stress response protein [Lentzea sp. NPDC051213]|uniref:Asp23/Gls24 family envelope stress response protein n=1 Tax=Lentzea sp. NPDC051213 TaxID=3364126 RepID=UPI0037B1A3BE
MSEIMSTLFGRPKNDATDSPEDSAAPTTAPADTDETVDTEAIEAEATEDDAAEDDSTPDSDDTDEATADEDVAPEAADEITDETADEDEESAADDEPVAVETEDTDVDAAEPEAVEADAVEPEAVEADAVEPEAVEADTVEADAPEAGAVEADATVAAPARAAAGTRGNITVDDAVVAKVVTIVAGKIDGVHSLAADGISVEVDGDVATIKVSLVIEFGHAIKALAEQVRTDVIEAVEQFLGYDVAAVDVHVSDIHLPETA